MTKIADLKQQIASETDLAVKVALYEQLVPMLKEPRIRYKDMTAEERAAFRAEKRARRAYNREHGINSRTGKPWTEEQRAKQQARWTPEARAAASAKAKGRKQSPEAVAKVREAAAARKQRQAAMEARLKELEAMLAAQTGKAAEAASTEPVAEHRGRNRK